MVNYMLMITAELENLIKLQPQGGCDSPNFIFILKLKCGNCGETTEKEACLCLKDEYKVLYFGNVHHAQKCKLCQRLGSVTMIPGQGRPLTLRMSETGKYAPVMQFDCNGFEPIEFVFRDAWEAVSRAHTKFKNIDLSGDENSKVGEFAEYDEKGKCPVSIINVTYVFKVVY